MRNLPFAQNLGNLTYLIFAILFQSVQFFVEFIFRKLAGFMLIFEFFPTGSSVVGNFLFEFINLFLPFP